MAPKVIEALLSMGYRKIVREDGVVAYSKPIGYSLFIYKDDGRLYQYFKGANEQILCMSSWDIPEDDPLCYIKESENYHHQVAALDSSFEFLTPMQRANLMVGEPE